MTNTFVDDFSNFVVEITPDFAVTSESDLDNEYFKFWDNFLATKKESKSEVTVYTYIGSCSGTVLKQQIKAKDIRFNPRACGYEYEALFELKHDNYLDIKYDSYKIYGADMIIYYLHDGSSIQFC